MLAPLTLQVAYELVYILGKPRTSLSAVASVKGTLPSPLLTHHVKLSSVEPHHHHNIRHATLLLTPQLDLCGSSAIITITTPYSFSFFITSLPSTLDGAT